jgi:ATP-dependent Clp protease ATP-binding subunit ClpA
VYVEDLDIPTSKVGETARRVIDRAFDDVHRRRHAQVGTDHLFLSLAQMEWDTFATIMRDVGVSPHAVLQAVEAQVRLLPVGDSHQVAVEPAAKLIMKLALHHASRAGRHVIEATDLLAAIFEDKHGTHASVLERYGVEPETVIVRLKTLVGNLGLQEEWLKKRFELPPYLKQFATNLNLLARQDKLPPVYGREHEIEQVSEILCHRERANSVMLIGEPGVGKTAIVEGLARRIEFQPDSMPVRLRDCQTVSLQMNGIVSDAIISMTSNVGSEHFRKLTSPLGFLSRQVGAEQIQSEILREVERRFSPEFRNRIDDVVLFSPLARDDVREIARQYLAKIHERALRRADDQDRWQALGSSLAKAAAWRRARFLKRVIDERVKLPISARWRGSDHFHVRVESHEVVVDIRSPELAAA